MICTLREEWVKKSRHNWVHSRNNGRQDNPNGPDKADFKKNIFLSLPTVYVEDSMLKISN